MALTWNDAEDVPEPHRGRRSQFLDIVEAVASSPKRAVVVASDEIEELDRFYRSFVQWRLRHAARYPTLNVRKADGRVYVWLDDDKRLSGAVMGRRSTKYVLTRGDAAATAGTTRPRRPAATNATGQKPDRGTVADDGKVNSSRTHRDAGAWVRS